MKLSFDYPKLIAHPRFKKLRSLLGEDQGRALDCICRFWNAALEHWADRRKLVPAADFDLDDEFAFLLQTNWAERQPDGIYAKGAKDFFEWAADLRDFSSSGGKASVEARREKYGSAQPRKLDPAIVEALRDAPQAGSTEPVRESPEGVREILEPSRRVSNASISVSTSVSTSVSPSVSVSTAEPETLSPPKQRKPRLPGTYSEADLAVGREWLAFAATEMPWKANDKSWTAERFAEALGRVRRSTGITEAGLGEILRFIRADDFWRKNAISPAGLLAKSSSSGERKIDNILVRMRKKEDRTRDTLAQWAEENS